MSESNTEKRQSHRDEGRWRWEYREMENGGRTNEQTGGRTELDEGQEGKKRGKGEQGDRYLTVQLPALWAWQMVKAVFKAMSCPSEVSTSGPSPEVPRLHLCSG